MSKAALKVKQEKPAVPEKAKELTFVDEMRKNRKAGTVLATPPPSPKAAK